MKQGMKVTNKWLWINFDDRTVVISRKNIISAAYIDAEDKTYIRTVENDLFIVDGNRLDMITFGD